MKTAEYIYKFKPCGPSIEFLNKFETFEEAWEACERGGWMLDAAQLLGVDLRTLTLAKGMCANTVRHLMKDKRSTEAVDAAMAFGGEQITLKELKAADAGATAAYTDACISSIYPDIEVAFAAGCASYINACASYVAESACEIAYAYYARQKKNKETADICREVLTEAVFGKIKE